MRSDQTQEYRDYLASAKWNKFKAQVVAAKGGKCQRCGSFMGLDVHHLHYDSLGRENLTDVELVCQICHPEADADRRLQSFLDRVVSGVQRAKDRARANHCQWLGNVDDFMVRKHGVNWSLKFTSENAEAFYSTHLEWLESPEGEAWIESKENAEEWGGDDHD